MRDCGKPGIYTLKFECFLLASQKLEFISLFNIAAVIDSRHLSPLKTLAISGQSSLRTGLWPKKCNKNVQPSPSRKPISSVPRISNNRQFTIYFSIFRDVYCLIDFAAAGGWWNNVPRKSNIIVTAEYINF